MGSNNENIKGVDELIKKLHEAKQYIQNDVPVVMGVEAVNHFKAGFQNEGFTDTSLQKWAPRKSKRTGSTNGQKVLSKSGELGDSIDYRVDGNTVIIYSDKVYAEIHNEGGEITVTTQMKKMFWAKHYEAKEAGDADLAEQYRCMALAKKIVMPKREIIANSHVLNEKIQNKITRDLTRILN